MRIGGTNGAGGPQRIYPRATGEGAAKPAASSPDGDRVELSDTARLSAAIAQIPDIRADKVARAKELIASGQLDTPESMNVAVDRLIEDFMGQREVE